MKSSIANCTNVAALLLVAFLGMGQAIAETTQPGAMCKPEGANNRSNFIYEFGGLRNASTSNQVVYCPVVRTKTPRDTGFRVRVDLDVLPADCTLYSYFTDGTWRGQYTVLNGGPGTVELVVDAARIPAGSYQFVGCTLQPGGRVIGIRPQQ